MGKGRPIPRACILRCRSPRRTDGNGAACAAVCAVGWEAAAVAQDAGTDPASDAAGDVRMTGVAEGVTDGEVDADAAGAERAGALGPAALIAAALCPVSVISNTIAVTATTRPPAPTATPDRKLISSMRA